MFGALVLADIDRFKRVNDRYGHQIGDRILQIIGRAFREASHSNLLVARTGGEEFAMVLEGKNEAAVEGMPFVNANTGMDYGPITLSLGLCMATEADGPDDLYMKADRALYASKSAGRNRVTRHSRLNAGELSKNWLIYSNE
jgi:diguanylate cyclase